MKIIFLAIVFLGLSNVGQSQVVNDTTKQQNTVEFSVRNLLNPSFHHQEITLINPFYYDEPIEGTVKSLLILGTDLIRGENEKYSIYSFENSWRYPGVTVKYPQTTTEMELFLKRYNRHDPDSQE